MTNKSEIRDVIKKECGPKVTEEQIDILLADHDKAGDMVSVHMGRYNDLTSGAVRQLDSNMQMLFENLAGRLTKLEKEVEELKTDKLQLIAALKD